MLLGRLEKAAAVADMAVQITVLVVMEAPVIIISQLQAQEAFAS